MTPSRTEPPAPPAGLIRRLPTGVPGLDAVLGGGLPELSFNLLAGGPGAGKTTFAQQLLFANATRERPGLYFTILGEPTLKMLRYQRQFPFFDLARVGTDVHLLNLGAEAVAGDLDGVLARVVADVERYTPGFVVVDSFGTLGQRAVHTGRAGADPIALQQFVQQLALQLTTWEVTSLLLSETTDGEPQHPVLTVADGIVRLSQVADRNSVVRKLQVVKVRGQAFMPGLHTFRITDAGLQVFPRIPEQQMQRRPLAGTAGDGAAPRRLATGVPGLDEMVSGGIPAGDALMLAGTTGTGKTTFATQFVAAGHAAGESAVVAVFEEYPDAYLARARGLGFDLGAMVEAGTLRVIYLRPLDLSVDETLAEILAAVEQTGATRVVIDSVSGFELALAPSFREEFRESFYRLVGALTAVGVTLLLINEMTGPLGDAGVTGERVSFVTDDIIVQRRVELEGRLRTVLAVLKMRGSAHSHDVREYTITAQGAVVGETLPGYHGLLTGTPDHGAPDRGPLERGHAPAGLTDAEAGVLDALVRLRETTVAALATRAGVLPETAARALDRFVALDYAVRVDDTDAPDDAAGPQAAGPDATYRATARGSAP